MCAVFTSLGSATACIVLAALLVTGAGGNDVTSQQCKNRGSRERVRQYPEDRDATRLWLDNCNIDEINETDITGLPNITGIHLHNSAIARVDLAVFRHVPTLEYLYLYNSKLRELPAFPEHSCPRLIMLSLFNNQLTTLQDGNFSACTQLQSLYLSNNLINFIRPDAFSSLTELIRLDLDHNELSYIPDQMCVNNKKLRYLYLHNNRLTYLPQDFASSIKRAGGGLDKFHFHDNPWRCACLLELLADVQRAGVGYADYGGAYPACVYSGAVACYPPSGRLRPSPALQGGGRART